MKLIKKEVKINVETFQPELIITLAIPLEPLQDLQSEIGEDEMNTVLGKQLVNLIK